MKSNKKKIIGCAIAVLCGVPLFVYAQGIGIPCDGPDCGFEQLIILANNIIQFLMYKIAVPLAAVGFMFVGGRLIFMQNKEEEWSKAKESFQNIGLGFVIMAGAFLLIKFVLYMFITNDQKAFIDFLIG